MTVHVPDGSILAIHSVVIAESYRRRGIATHMLRHYRQHIVQQQQHSATNDISESVGRTYFVADAFADSNKKGKGNPAAIVPVDYEPMDVGWMQVIAQEMNLSETTFVWKIPLHSDEAPSSASVNSGDGVESNHYRIRYFTPTMEVDLCGHATLASAAILCNISSTRESTGTIYNDSEVATRLVNGQ